MPKQLAQKHQTIDCDELGWSAPVGQQQTNTTNLPPRPRPPPPPPPPDRTGAADAIAPTSGRFDANAARETPDALANQSQHCQLSKLVLSNSLHQLAEANFHTNNHHLHHLHNNMDAPPPPPPAVDAPPPETQTLCNYNNNNNNATHSSAPPKQKPPSLARQRQQHNDATIAPNGHQQNDQNKPEPNGAHGTGAAATANKKREANLDTVHVVVGNESCDLDSAVSCLLMFHIISKMSDELNGKDKTRTLYIPLLNTTRDMLDSKREVLWFLAKTLNIDKTFLTCKDDIDWPEIKKNGVEVLITLVDHNYNDEFKDIGKVVEIIDHHQVQNAEWLLENQAQIRLTLDTSVGSCTTLVAERLFYIYAEHHVSDEILHLIYGTLLLDTICLSEKAKRFTRRDVYLLRKLDQLLGARRPNRDQLYKQLVEVKNSTRELDFEQLMRRDLKVYRDKRGMRVGIASLFGMAAREALGLAADVDLDAFFRQNQYEAFIIMGLIADLEHSDSISRDLVLISAQPALFEKLCQAFEADTSKLDLVAVSGNDSNPDPEDNVINRRKIVDSSSLDCGPDGFCPFYRARIWLQRNVSSSRKVVAPLLLKVLHDGAQ